MRRLLAAFLLVCFGILVPLAASPMRVCLLGGGISGSGLSTANEADCCKDCHRETAPDPCCVELEKLPDSSAPQPPLEVPLAVLAELPQLPCPVIVMRELPCEAFSVSEPIRGPTSPAAYRAVLGIWRL